MEDARLFPVFERVIQNRFIHFNNAAADPEDIFFGDFFEEQPEITRLHIQTEADNSLRTSRF